MNASGTQHRPRPRRLRRRLRLGRRLRHPEEGRLQRHHRPEPDHLAGRRRGLHQARHRRAERPGRCWSATPTAAWSSPKPATIPRSRALVYIAAFAPDKGESVGSLIKNPPPGRAGAADPAAAGRLPAPRPGEVRGLVRRRRRRRQGRASWPTRRCRGASTRSPAQVTAPAWKTKPSWYLVATDDRMIPPPAQRQMAQRAGATVTEVAGSHAVYVSRPEAVAELIRRAADELGR